ncbi:MAG: aspartate kinase [Candidatus Nanohaloarchaea archaeon]|nr:aspartate kinase [Candidatus Nanohaloarchaea archaeon]
MHIVSKFGGTSLRNGARIEQAADAIADAVDSGHDVTVVASAMGDTTDNLIDNITFEAQDHEKDEIISMGERTSIRMLKAALSSRGVDAAFIEPGDEAWPVHVTEDGDIDEERTREASQSLASRREERVIIVAGFLAETPDGQITTLERGGSDTSATLLGNTMDADRVVIVTDVEGVLTGSPEIVEQPHNVGEITVEELRELSFRGAEVVAPQALNYKSADMDVHVVHYQEQNLLESGTSIEGEFERIIDARDRPLACLTVAGREMRNESGVLASLSSLLAVNNINIEAVGSGMDSVAFYVDQERADRAKQLLHSKVVDEDHLASITLQKDIAAIRVVGGKLPDRPGMLSRLLQPISEQHINIQEVVTSATSITVFVDWDSRDQTLRTVQDVFGDSDG